MQAQIDALAAKYADRHADTDGTWALQSGVLALQEGRLGGLLEPLRSTMQSSTVPSAWTAAFGLALLGNGEIGAANDVLDSCAAPSLDYLWLSAKLSTAELAVGLGRTDHCARLLHELMPFRGQVGLIASGSGCYGLVSRSLGQLAFALEDTELAIELLSEATAQAEKIGAPYEAATARSFLARIAGP